MVIIRGEAPDDVLEVSKTEFAMLEKLDGAISKKKRKKSAISSGAGQAVRRNKIQPIIIHAVSPPLFHAEPSTFMRIVQSLTGCAATRLRCEEEEALLNRAGSPMSCGAAPVVQSLKGRRCVATTQAQWLDEEVAMTSARAGSPVSVGAAAVGSPCNSTTSTMTATTTHTSISGDVDLDANAGFMGSFEELMAENEVACMERRDEGRISSPSADGSTCISLLLDSMEQHHVFFNSGASASHVDDEEHLFPADSDVHAQDLESTLDSYFAHLLSSYDRDANCKFASTSALLADVCDPLLL